MSVTRSYLRPYPCCHGLRRQRRDALIRIAGHHGWVTFAAGGSSDVLARAVPRRIVGRARPTGVVDNRPAREAISVPSGRHAAPDATRFCSAPTARLASGPGSNANLRYNPSTISRRWGSPQDCAFVDRQSVCPRHKT